MRLCLHSADLVPDNLIESKVIMKQFLPFLLLMLLLICDTLYWVNLLGKSVHTLSVGQSYGGGKVAYIFTPTDPGYVANETHGLIAATSDQSTSAEIRWDNGATRTTGATAIAIGTGLANTNTIINSQGATATSYAAGLARAQWRRIW